MKRIFKQTAIAALTKKQSNNNDAALAVLTYSVGEISDTNDQRVQLLPDGQFSSTDGRPEDVEGGKWLMDAVAFASLKASADARKNDYLFDYEHQTMLTEENGEKAPAAGWFKNLEYIPGEGLFATLVDRTPTAIAHLKAKEYRYTSAVFSYDTNTGRPIGLLHAALTNDPAVDGMKAIAALKVKPTISNQPSGEEPMNEAFKLFLELLGVATDGVDFTNEAALKKVKDQATTAITALKTKADRSGQLEKDLNTANQSVVALKAGGAKSVDMTQFVPAATYNAAMTKIAALTNGSDKTSIEQLLKDNAAKVYGQEDRDYLETLGKENGVAALKSALSARVAIAALTKTQTQDKTQQQNDKTTVSDEDKAMVVAMGISDEDVTKFAGE